MTLLIADDHTIVRTGLIALLGTEDDMTVVGEARTGVEAVEQARTLRPDVIIMDLMMPQLTGDAATTQILAERPETRILILTSYGSADALSRALHAGAAGALSKTAEDAALITALRKIFAGETVISPDIARELGEHPACDELTPRQRQVLEALARGLTNADIARLLDIRRDGVDEHVSALLRKIGAANRTEAVALAYRRHLL